MKIGSPVIIKQLIIFGLIAGSAAYIAIAKPAPVTKFVQTDIPAYIANIEQKLKSIITPKPPIGDITPTRDLRGNWTSSLQGKGLQLYGKFVTGKSTTQLYEDGDIDLVIDSVVGNTASGTIRYRNLKATGTTVVPGYGTITVPPVQYGDTGERPIQIRVSGSKLDFGTINTGDVNFTMQGNYTTDIISGTMTATTSYGVIKGEFHLSRVK